MLRFDELRKSYGEKSVLRGLTFEVRPGEMFGFCGANGAGKTTAMRIALGMATADSGAVSWAGRSIGVAERERIGYMPEERGLYGRMKPADQLVYLARLSGMKAAVARARANEWLERLNVKMRPADTLDKLSLGNQQKVQLIASVIHEPEVLILDEPFSGLDPVATDTLADVLDDIRATGVPVLFSSHQLDLVERLCQRVGIMSGGALVAVGGVEELRRAHGQRRLAITLSDPVTPEWPARLPVGRIIQRDAAAMLAEIGPDHRLDEIVSAAQALGTIRHLSVVEPTLFDIFRNVVSA
ncbi:ABC-2 type transport system ATP-binding protein [Pseudonocardia eucalypti]|nr:ABC-2 type transport system ATP-binding protein [Pseudonocardia eucalypti]